MKLIAILRENLDEEIKKEAARPQKAKDTEPKTIYPKNL